MDEPLTLPHDWPDHYLARIGASRPARADLAALAELSTRHGRAVPFENLDIGRGRRIELSTESTIRKIVFERRGGCCFEINEAFRALLAALGFAARRIEGRVWIEASQEFGAPFDHLALVVDLPEGAFLVDVGFGDNNRLPLRLPDGETEDLSGRYRLRHARIEDRLVLERLPADGTTPRPLYEMTLASRSLADFEPMCRYHQSSPDSIFTKGMICTMATETGRLTLGRNRFVEAIGETRHETPVRSDDERDDILRRRFGIVLR